MAWWTNPPSQLCCALQAWQAVPYIVQAQSDVLTWCRNVYAVLLYCGTQYHLSQQGNDANNTEQHGPACEAFWGAEATDIISLGPFKTSRPCLPAGAWCSLLCFSSLFVSFSMAFHSLQVLSVAASSLCLLFMAFSAKLIENNLPFS